MSVAFLGLSRLLDTIAILRDKMPMEPSTMPKYLTLYDDCPIMEGAVLPSPMNYESA